MKLTAMFGILIFTSLILWATFSLPASSNDKIRNVYLEQALDKTGSANIVNAIVWDFRAYDTLGEETVLFTTVLAIFLIVHRKSEFSIKTMKKQLKKTQE